MCNGIYNYITENACDDIWKHKDCSRMREGYKTCLLFACVFPSFPDLENGAGLWNNGAEFWNDAVGHLRRFY